MPLTHSAPARVFPAPRPRGRARCARGRLRRAEPDGDRPDRTSRHAGSAAAGAEGSPGPSASPSQAKRAKSARKLIQEGVLLVEGGGSGLMVMRRSSGRRPDVVRQRSDGLDRAREVLDPGVRIAPRQRLEDGAREGLLGEAQERAPVEAAARQRRLQRRGLLGREGGRRPQPVIGLVAEPLRGLAIAFQDLRQVVGAASGLVQPDRRVALLARDRPALQRLGRTRPALRALPMADGGSRNADGRADLLVGHDGGLAEHPGLRFRLVGMAPRHRLLRSRGQGAAHEKNRPARRAGG